MLEKKVFEGIRDLPRIKELDFSPTQGYDISTREEVLFPLIDDHSVIVVCGAYFGDEGKGKIVDAVLTHPGIEVIVRTNSGQNAGHTVIDSRTGVKYAFHAVPSGILGGKTCVIGQNCVIDPIRLMNEEIAQLAANSVDYSRLFVDNFCITTPYHILVDMLCSPENSSTLQGISPIHSSKVTKKALRLEDLYNSPERQEKIIRRDMEQYEAMLLARHLDNAQIIERCEKENATRKRIPDHVMGFLRADNPVAYLIDLYQKMVVLNKSFPRVGDGEALVKNALLEGKKVLLEAAQSFFLSNAVQQHYRSSTSADTTAAGTIASMGYNLQEHDALIINIHKLPPSRVGLGENPSGLVPQDYFSKRKVKCLEQLTGKCEDTALIEKAYFESVKENGVIEPRLFTDADGTEYMAGEALAISWSRKFGECGATTGKPRVLGFFDCVKHHYVNSRQGPYLSISALDRLDECEKIGLTIAYVYHNPEKGSEFSKRWYRNGDIIRPGDPLPNENVLAYCRPIVKVLPGWKGNPIRKGTRDENESLPQQLQDLLAAIEHYTGAKIISIGNGPNSDDLLYISRRREHKKLGLVGQLELLLHSLPKPIF